MNKMLAWLAVFGMIITYVVACAPVKFSANSSPDTGFAYGCKAGEAACSFDYVTTVKGGKVDILFVNDNSASMSFEQKSLANRFSGFVQLLDSKFVDYRIAMITTDIHVDGDNNLPRAINGNGALQNGHLISFGDGVNYLTPDVPDRVGRFAATIVRPETLQCEQFIANWVAAGKSTTSSDYSQQYNDNCPSGDERGTYAAKLAIESNSGGFMRSDAYLAIIFVSDEDVRSGLYCNGPNNSQCENVGYPLSDNDQPLGVFNALKALNKKDVTDIHSVVVTDSTCLSQQNSQTLGNPAVAATSGFVRGSLGNVYLNFYQNGWGQAVSICLDNYTEGLKTIANTVPKNGEVIACDNPVGLQVTTIPADSTFSFTRTGRNVSYNKNLPVGSQVRFQYSCPTVN